MRAPGFELLPPSVGSICKLEIPASFCTLLLTSLAACEAIMESVLWLEAADSCVVLPRAIRLMTSAVARGGSETYDVVSLSSGPRMVSVRLYCSTVVVTETLSTG